jgi:hypothetical protein
MYQASIADTTFPPDRPLGRATIKAPIKTAIKAPIKTAIKAPIKTAIKAPIKTAIKLAFDEYFAGYQLILPAECLNGAAGEFDQNGWQVQYRLDVEDGRPVLECFATHHAINDRLYQVHADGRVELVDSSTDGVLLDHDRRFYERVVRRGHM